MPEASLSCYTRQDGRTLVTVLEGCLDVVNAPQAIEFFAGHIDRHGPEVRVDTSRLDFIDSKGVGALISASRLAHDRGGYVHLADPPFPVRRILETCGLLPLFMAPPPPRERAAPEAEPAVPAEPRARKPRRAT